MMSKMGTMMDGMSMSMDKMGKMMKYKLGPFFLLGKREAIVVPSTAGRPLSVLGETITVKVTGAETGGAYSVIEEVVPPQGGPPLHRHLNEDETLYILDGECEVTCGARTFKAAKNSLAILPRNIPHAFRNTGPGPCRILVFITPGGFEMFFEEVSRLPPDRDVPLPRETGMSAAGPPDRPPDMAGIAAIAQKFRLELLPPSGGRKDG